MDRTGVGRRRLVKIEESTSCAHRPPRQVALAVLALTVAALRCLHHCRAHSASPGECCWNRMLVSLRWVSESCGARGERVQCGAGRPPGEDLRGRGPLGLE
jgi:hypothetical protein